MNRRAKTMKPIAAISACAVWLLACSADLQDANRCSMLARSMCADKGNVDVCIEAVKVVCEEYEPTVDDVDECLTELDELRSQLGQTCLPMLRPVWMTCTIPLWPSSPCPVADEGVGETSCGALAGSACEGKENTQSCVAAMTSRCEANQPTPDEVETCASELADYREENGLACLEAQPALPACSLDFWVSGHSCPF